MSSIMPGTKKNKGERPVDSRPPSEPEQDEATFGNTLRNDPDLDTRPLKKPRIAGDNEDPSQMVQDEGKEEKRANCQEKLAVKEKSDTRQSHVINRQAGQTFAAVFGVQNPSTSVSDVTGSSTSTLEKKDENLASKMVYLEDQDTFVVQRLPEQCEVTDVNLQDEILRDGYLNLPPLREGTFLSWDAASGPGHPRFSDFWGTVIPAMRIWNCVDAVQFTQSGRFVNPSRVDPRQVSVKRHNPDGSALRMYVGGSFAICITAIAVTESYLTRPPSTGLRQRQLKGLVHSQDWDRLVAFFCMAFNQPVLAAQVYKDALSFTTKTGANNKRHAQASLFSPSKKTGQVSGRQTQRNSESFLLDADENIPVYDARSVDFNLQKNILDFKNTLPLLSGEVDRDSFAVVGYTAGSYRSVKDNRWNFSANLQWAIILGVPDGGDC